jgi:ectoine hydroxylase
MSVKVAFWLSDVSQTGRGNMLVVPGSHRANWLPGPPGPDVPWPTPAGAREITAAPGDALIFNRRLWHARSDNRSQVTRNVVFFGYSYRWVVARDDVGALPAHPWFDDLTAVQQQLLGQCPSGDHAWGLDPADHPALHRSARPRAARPIRAATATVVGTPNDNRRPEGRRLL